VSDLVGDLHHPVGAAFETGADQRVAGGGGVIIKGVLDPVSKALHDRLKTVLEQLLFEPQ